MQIIMCMPIFILRCLQPQISIIKSQVYLEGPFANQLIFLCDQDVRARTMGCKRGFTFELNAIAILRFSNTSI